MERCLCGHLREGQHQPLGGACLICDHFVPSNEVTPGKFICKPGVCQRFTWDPNQ